MNNARCPKYLWIFIFHNHGSGLANRCIICNNLHYGYFASWACCLAKKACFSASELVAAAPLLTDGTLADPVENEGGGTTLVVKSLPFFCPLPATLDDWAMTVVAKFLDCCNRQKLEEWWTNPLAWHLESLLTLHQSPLLHFNSLAAPTCGWNEAKKTFLRVRRLPFWGTRVLNLWHRLLKCRTRF